MASAPKRCRSSSPALSNDQAEDNETPSFNLYTMSEKHRKTLTRNRVVLLSNITLSQNLLGYLLMDDTLTQDMVDEIMSKPLPKDRIGHLLYFIPRRGPQAFDSFIRALVATNHYTLARHLELFAKSVVV